MEQVERDEHRGKCEKSGEEREREKKCVERRALV